MTGKRDNHHLLNTRISRRSALKGAGAALGGAGKRSAAITEQIPFR